MARLIFLALVVAVVTFAIVSAEDVVSVEVLKTGKEGCRQAKNGDSLQMHYDGALADGTPFDSSYKRGQPLPFTLGSRQVIQGWEQGSVGMCVGEVRRLTIPPSLGYGSRGAGGVIPPDATLVFKTELVGITNAEAPEDL
jgi:FKBP-type peptidyl-prolyl cis-trans isomerase